MIVHRAPGKLFVAGEFAVVEPGRSAVLVAVDRYVEVAVAPGTDRAAEVTVRSDLSGTARLRRVGGRLVALDSSGADLVHVITAIETVEQFAGELGRGPVAVELTIASTMHEHGTKFGLGSSGAVTTAVVAALSEFLGIELTAAQRFRLALLASVRLDRRASGADLAVSTWGGWLAYRAPDREAVHLLSARHGLRHALHADWPGLSIHPLRAPPDIDLLVGWTGTPASTGDQLAKLYGGEVRTSTAYRTFLRESGTCAAALESAVREGDSAWLLRGVRRCHSILRVFDNAARLGIFTERLTALCATAEAAGGAAKPSGAGGGDCGIALLHGDARAAAAALSEQWQAHGIRPLPVAISTSAGAAR
ncbi:phosphomevalonate kinase [Nocardia brasiliensis]|uniref:Phosphomevalonate kinase n=1 Tax=Nocardia brasiliensis (strain ATCC 700358 / HUJEG-1) TaxID=1133849 RepID=K0EVF0_NOCB7|nr:phosphomevalonate kinase [Nocardia brasiliensis]AFT99550.1 phosphomevalonate kinase [Nocardia brasiliensis ATCC 700358]